jgi:hypothetical protein
MTIDFLFLKRKNINTSKVEAFSITQTWICEDENDTLLEKAKKYFTFDGHHEEEVLLNLLNSSQNIYEYYFDY